MQSNVKRRPLDSLFWRLAIMVLILAVAGQSFALFLVAKQRESLQVKQLRSEALSVSARLEERMEAMSRAERAIFLQDYNQPFETQLLALGNRAAPNAAPHSALARKASRALDAAFGHALPARERGSPQPQLWLQVRLLEQDYWLVLPLGRYVSEPRWPWGVSAALFAVLSIAAAWGFAWRLNRPLRLLTARAGQLSAGALPPPVPVAGPAEIRALATGFNQMLAALASADQERTTMLVGVSHDIKTPLTRLRMAVEMQADPAERDGMVEDIEQISRILDQFSAFLRGADEPFGALDAAQLLQRVAERYRRQGRAVQLQLPVRLPPLPAQALALERLLGNLLDNALRHGGEPVELSAVRTGDWLQLTVRDHGAGIAAEQHAEALLPFTRLDAARSADGGSGLGLAIVKRIVDRHGGRLTLQEAAGGGLLVQVELPLATPLG